MLNICLLVVLIFAFLLPQGVSHFTPVTKFLYPSTSIKAGSLLEVNDSDPERSYWLIDKKLHFSKDIKKFIGVAGLYSPDISLLHSWSLNDYSKSIWGSKTFFWSRQYLKILKPPLKKIAKLRIPNSVWNKVNIEQDPRKLRDRKRMGKILQHKSSVKDAKFCFSIPLQSKVVSKFGAPRSLPNGKSYYHTGVDYRAYYNTPIPSMGDGRVVFADHMVVPGNTIVVDHGAGFYSRYMHLKEFNVLPGEWVKAGDIVGFSGATGRVEAPHLHWEVLWKGNRGNPRQLLSNMNRYCSKNL